jgi:hypothetical protein
MKMTGVFLEIVFQTDDFIASGIEGRDEIEEVLEEYLLANDLGEVTGGGAGSGVSIIDIEIEDENTLESALRLIRQVLQDLNVPKNTTIKQYEPVTITYRVYD